MQSEITSRELVEWMTFMAVEPVGELRADFRNALLCQLVYNSHRDPRKSRPATLEEWMPKFQSALSQSNSLLTKVANINMKLGGRDLRAR